MLAGGPRQIEICDPGAGSPLGNAIFPKATFSHECGKRHSVPFSSTTTRWRAEAFARSGRFILGAKSSPERSFGRNVVLTVGLLDVSRMST
jgi:hypothetical protein